MGNGNMALPNVRLSSDTSTSLHPLSSNYIRLRHTHTYRRKDILVETVYLSHILSVAILNNISYACNSI